MAPKRASFLAKLENEGLPEQPKAAAPVAAKPAAVARAATPLTRPDIVKSTVYIPDAVHERLREIAFTERCRLHDLIMEGLDRVMESRGHAERATRKPS